MADMTFKTNLNNLWVEVADGDSDGSVGIQVDSGTVLVFIGDGAPGNDEANYMVMEKKHTGELSVDLPAGQKVYARSERASAVIRGFKVPAA